MKRIFLLTVTILISIGLSARTFVLVIGVSNYGSESNNLRQTTKDAKAFKKVMESQTKDITLLTSKYANKANILEKLRAICNRAGKDDRIVFFFSGHGMSGGICAYDGVIYYTELIALLTSSDAQYKIAYIDACHAGTIFGGTPTKEQQGLNALLNVAKEKKDQIFFVGCRGGEYSLESAWVGAGYFSQALIKGLRGKCDRNGDRHITVLELFKYIYNDVVKRSLSKQHPQLIVSQALQEAVIATWN
ncbi:MAG: caspase family protein [Prevotellaceae bacterium]|nr:caspase family protein [Prevotellaceae bacterium]